MKYVFKVVFCLVYLLPGSSVFAQTAVEELQQQLESFNSLTADFEQRVTDQDSKLVDMLTGKFFLKRPGQFKWQYADEQQDIVSDGKKIYFIMRDLEQVIERDFSTALETVPSLVLVTDPSKLSKLFAIEKSVTSRGETFSLLPKSLDSSYESVTVSFLNGKLLGLRLIDVLGQTTEIILSGVKNNSNIPSREFKVVVPKGFDVIQG